MPASKAQQAATAKRRAQAVEMKLSKVPYAIIAERLGYASEQAASVDIRRALERNLIELSGNIDLLRQEEIETLDLLQRAIMPKALKGDLGAADRVLRIVAQRSKLRGLDPSLTVNVEVTAIDNIERQIKEMNTQLALEGGTIEYEWDDDAGRIQALPAGGAEAAEAEA